MLVGSVVWTVGREARVVAANLKGIRLGIAQLAEEFHVGGIPFVFPFCLPVVRYVVLELVVPDGLQLHVDVGQVHGGILALFVQIEHRVALAADHCHTAEYKEQL